MSPVHPTECCLYNRGRAAIDWWIQESLNHILDYSEALSAGQGLPLLTILGTSHQPKSDVGQQNTVALQPNTPFRLIFFFFLCDGSVSLRMKPDIYHGFETQGPAHQAAAGPTYWAQFWLPHQPFSPHLLGKEALKSQHKAVLRNRSSNWRMELFLAVSSLCLLPTGGQITTSLELTAQKQQ